MYFVKSLLQMHIGNTQARAENVCEDNKQHEKVATMPQCFMFDVQLDFQFRGGRGDQYD